MRRQFGRLVGVVAPRRSAGFEVRFPGDGTLASRQAVGRLGLPTAGSPGGGASRTAGWRGRGAPEGFGWFLILKSGYANPVAAVLLLWQSRRVRGGIGQARGEPWNFRIFLLDGTVKGGGLLRPFWGQMAEATAS